MLSCAGNKFLKTPALDSLAAEGTRFEKAYCSNPVCSPSRFSLFTGRMPGEINLYYNEEESYRREPPREITEKGLGHLMRSAGYDTRYGGKEHMPSSGIADYGFNSFCRDERDGLADACVDFLKTPRDGPFFLTASFINPHDICFMAILEALKTEEGQKRYHDYFGVGEEQAHIKSIREAMKLPGGMSEEDFVREHCPPLPDNHKPQDEEPEIIREMMRAQYFRTVAREVYTDSRWQMQRQVYCRLTERVDHQIGKVLQALRQSGEYDNTVIIYTSDHGECDGSHCMEEKVFPYEEASRVPVIISAPGFRSQSRVEQSNIVSNGLDIYPTICDFAGAVPVAGLRGISLKPFVTGGASTINREYIPIETVVGNGLIFKNRKYVFYNHGSHQEQIYDLIKDPGETKNFAKDPDYRTFLNRSRTLFVREWPNQKEIDRSIDLSRFMC